ncbi:DNA-3-methyladenine glycosylase I [Alteromonas lipolytica]|uniref:DNA-3-methyladenine glycosylase I n=1 Tax=Alteromonas lipolytica TaxID=1856405 RepID=A0A1E8FAD0_9ALTE|nr:DNA-3-methyladenine glycosylase I [Alteromonas lipolytica]OFI32870.1 DNA-3-methyladenine glycosylase I [Alteromonas lipolytica]GGF64588.1 DNA-3-methyladenine glycosylase I [Alteromonas lipolytica]
MSEKRNRCGWVSDDPLYQHYHDTVWGRPELDSQQLFAKLCLDGQQAGLSWITILKKQAAFEDAFYHFDPVKIAKMTEADVERLMQNAGIIRSRAKINAIITNARAYLKLIETQSFSDFIWQFTGHKTIVNEWRDYRDAPTSTAESKAMAKALKKAGFKFVGETICYAFMQAVGMVNDHTLDCHCYSNVCELAK